MHWALDGAGGHLTYCTNVHPGEAWDDVRRHLEVDVPAVKARVAPDEPFGVGLRLSAQAAQGLVAGGELAGLRQRLRQRGLYVFTLNGFPYGTFHRAVVKQAVYAPDWRTPERLTYTRQLGEILAALLPEGVDGTVSTAPGGFRPDLVAEADRGRVAQQLVDAALSFWELSQDHGCRVALCVEPEPHCMVETTDEAIAFFEQWIWSGDAFARFERGTGLAGDAAAEALRRHLGLCLDACHAAVEYEEVDGLLSATRAAALPLHKVQLSAGLRVSPVDDDGLGALAPYLDEVYLHQVVARDGERLSRYLDLPEALASEAARAADEWRVHFHVPVFLRELGAFGSTQAFLSELLRAHRKAPITSHLEVETYTWEVLPAALRNEAVADDLARELSWVLRELGR